MDTVEKENLTGAGFDVDQPDTTAEAKERAEREDPLGLLKAYLSNPLAGRLRITIQGSQGAGKSTLAKHIIDAVNAWEGSPDIEIVSTCTPIIYTGTYIDEVTGKKVEKA